MATNEKGSDLDVFEGLNKKGGAGSPSSVPPPPPGPGVQQTLLGMTSPASLNEPTPTSPEGTLDPSFVSPAVDAPDLDGTANAAANAPPPPGRASLPPIDPVAPAFAAPSGPKPATDVDWDDEDEATHIFDKGDDAPRRSVPI